MNTDNNIATHPLSLALAGSGAGVGGVGLYQTLKAEKDLNSWAKHTNKFKDLISAGDTILPDSNLAVQTTVDDAEKILASYYNDKSKFLKNRILGIKLPSLLRKNDLRYVDQLGKYFDASTPGAAKTFNSIVNNLLIPTKGFAKDNADNLNFESLSDEAKKIIKNAPDIKSTRAALAKLGQNELTYFDRMLMGHASGGSGLAEMLNGSHYVTGDAQDYISAGRKLLSKLKGGFGVAAGLGALGLGAAGAAALNKSASMASGPVDEWGPLKDIAGGTLAAGALTAGGVTAGGAWEGLKAIANPNRTVGFTYGKWGAIGDGHEAPARALKSILSDPESYKDLGLSKSEIRQLKKLKLIDLPKLESGFNMSQSKLPKNFNMLIDTGMGFSRPDSAVVKNGYGSGWSDTTGASKRVMQQIKDLRAKTVLHYLTDLSRIGRTGATLDINNLHALQGTRNNIALTYGDLDDIAPLHNYIQGEIPHDVKDPNAVKAVAEHKAKLPTAPTEIVHLKNGGGIAPAINAESLNSLIKYKDNNAVMEAIEKSLATDLGNFDQAANSTFNGTRLKELLDFKRKGGKIVTIAGSGRGDYVIPRAVAMAEALQRKGLGADKVRIVPLMGNFVEDGRFAAGEKFRLTNKLAERLGDIDPRIKALGALYADKATKTVKPYELLQRLADINMASTGTSALAETAHSGALSLIPEQWSDWDDWNNPNARRNILYNKEARKEAILGLLGNDEVKLNDGTKARLKDLSGAFNNDVHLDAWNSGNMKQSVRYKNFMHVPSGAIAQGQKLLSDDALNGQKSLWQKFRSTFSPENAKLVSNEFVDKAVNQGFNMDAVADLLADDKKLTHMKDVAKQTALQNIQDTKLAQRDFVRTVLSNVNKNVWMDRLRGAGKFALPAALIGAGGLGMYHTLSN